MPSPYLRGLALAQNQGLAEGDLTVAAFAIQDGYRAAIGLKRAGFSGQTPRLMHQPMKLYHAVLKTSRRPGSARVFGDVTGVGGAKTARGQQAFAECRQFFKRYNGHSGNIQSRTAGQILFGCPPTLLRV